MTKRRSGSSTRRNENGERCVCVCACACAWPSLVQARRSVAVQLFVWDSTRISITKAFVLFRALICTTRRRPQESQKPVTFIHKNIFRLPACTGISPSDFAGTNKFQARLFLKFIVLYTKQGERRKEFLLLQEEKPTQAEL